MKLVHFDIIDKLTWQHVMDTVGLFGYEGLYGTHIESADWSGSKQKEHLKYHDSSVNGKKEFSICLDRSVRKITELSICHDRIVKQDSELLNHTVWSSNPLQ